MDIAETHAGNRTILFRTKTFGEKLLCSHRTTPAPRYCAVHIDI